MKIKIVKHSSRYYLYENLVGQIVDVEDELSSPNYYKYASSICQYILKSDCEPIIETADNYSELLKLKDEIIKYQQELIELLKNQIKGI